MRGVLHCNIEYDQPVLSYSLRLHDNFVDILKQGAGKESIFLKTETSEGLFTCTSCKIH